MQKTEIAEMLLERCEDFGIIETLRGTFGKRVAVSLPFSRSSCESSLDELEFSQRAQNALKRSGVFTLGELVDTIECGDLTRIRNLGKKTENEIKTRLLLYCYEHLGTRERKAFLLDMIERNTRAVRGA